MAEDTSDTPVEYCWAQKRLNRTGNLESVWEDWKRLQTLGLTNKYLESRSLSDFTVYTTPIGDLRLRTFTIKQRIWTVSPHAGSSPRIKSIHLMSFCRSLSPKKENTPGKTATARDVWISIFVQLLKTSHRISQRRDRCGSFHSNTISGESCIAQVFTLHAPRRSLKALETVAVQLCSVIEMAPKSPLLHTSNNQRLRSARYNDRKFKTLLLQRCALRKFLVTNGQNTRDQIFTIDRRAKRTWSNWVMCIPFTLSRSPSECWLHTCDAMRINNLEIRMAGSSCRPQ